MDFLSYVIHGNTSSVCSCFLLVDACLFWICFSDSCGKYGGGPTLSNCDHCNDCIFETGSKVRHANIYRDERLLMKELADAALSREPLDGKLFFVSKSWYEIFTEKCVSLFIINLIFSLLCFTVYYVLDLKKLIFISIDLF